MAMIRLVQMLDFFLNILMEIRSLSAQALSGSQHQPPTGNTEEWVAQQLQHEGKDLDVWCSQPLFFCPQKSHL
ncbi:hypothetical protein E2C01_008651 [Portunus trituberculatus]|uniref:Secreted protein n=1 Tax=Portunus trituberculatus TaxID=210409 RepID=A0A5B7D2J2_PORTR|nr:hypothetical protein [Portunus trituberculatus]